MPAWARLHAGGLRLSLHVQPGARRDALEGLHGARLKIALRAPAVEGQANEALRRFLAQTLGLRQADVQVVSGAMSREKIVAIAGAPGAVETLLAKLAASSARR